MLKNMGPFLFFFLLFACAEKRSIAPGLTTRSALVELKGAPENTQEVPGGEVLSYGTERYQIKREMLTAVFRDPVGEEKNLLFWRHKFRDCETTERKLSDEVNAEVEFACPSSGVSAIFVEGTGRVVRVSDYERP